MNRSTNTFILLGAGMVIGITITVGIYLLFPGKPDEPGNASQEKKPLYWVAPMDPNYKRDQPGKSPMGMDLIPVYADGEQYSSPGTIKISPSVVNNLGVRTATVEHKPLQSEIKTVGYIRYNQDRLVHIHPRVEGWIDKLHIKAEGDPVDKGQPLYELYSPTLVNAQEELMLALARNNDRLVRASEERLRALQLADSTIATLKKNKQVQQTVTFYAPQSGVVDNLSVREGFYVQPGVNLMSIGALDEVWVEAEVFERQAGMVKENAPVAMTLDYLPGTTWRGKVDYIYPTLDEKTRTVKVRIRFDNREKKLKPNMFAQVAIHTGAEGELLLIPRESLIRTGSSDRVVLALGDGQFKSVEVRVGRSDETHVEILDGLKAGEKVVSSAQFLLDSESSKTSDFKRMEHNNPASAEQTTPAEKAAWVEATIEEVDTDARQVSLNHGDIDAWEMPGMTMSFSVAESVNMAKLEAGMTLHVEITREDGGFSVTNTHIPQAGDGESMSDHSQPGSQRERSRDNSQH